jgi:hypothetical protein
MSSKKTSKTSSNQTSTSAPPSWTQPGLEAVSGMVTGALGDIPQTHYSGPQVAYMDPGSLGAIQGAWGDTANQANYYSNWMGEQMGPLTSMWDFQSELPTGSFNMGSMHDVNPVINAALHPVYEQLTQQILPGIQSSSLDSGAYTGDRAMSVLPQSALSDYSDSATRTAAGIGYENYRDFENRRLAAWSGDQDRMLGGYNAETARGLGAEQNQMGMMSSINDYVSGILRNSASVGDLLNMSAQLGVTNEQAMINDILAQDQYASYSPFMGLDQASNLLAQLSGNYGTQTSSGTAKTTEKTGGLGEWVKGAIGLASVAAAPFTGGASLAGLGAAGGGAAAGASGSINPLAQFGIQSSILPASGIFG